MSKDDKEGSPVGIGELKIGNTFIIDINRLIYGQKRQKYFKILF